MPSICLVWGESLQRVPLLVILGPHLWDRLERKKLSGEPPEGPLRGEGDIWTNHYIFLASLLCDIGLGCGKQAGRIPANLVRPRTVPPNAAHIAVMAFLNRSEVDDSSLFGEKWPTMQHVSAILL
jgi:hypothetical protein